MDVRYAEEVGKIMDDVDHMKAVLDRMPDKIKMNREYYFSLLHSSGIITKNPKTILGIPVEIDDSVETYRFIYYKDQSL